MKDKASKKEYSCKYEEWKYVFNPDDMDIWCTKKCEICDRHRCKEYEQGEEITVVNW